MENITSITRLKSAIQLLEAEHAKKGMLLKEHFYFTCKKLEPVGLLRSSLDDVSSSPNLIGSILSTVIGLGTGYFSKKLVVGASVSSFRRLLGSVLQFGITNVIAQHPDAIKSFGRVIIQHILRKKVINPDKP